MSQPPGHDRSFRFASTVLSAKSLPATGSRFIFTGIGATATYLLAANLLLSLRVNPELASVLAYLAGMVVSFFGHKLLTFQVKGDMGGQWVRFTVFSAFGLSLSYAIMFGTTNWLGWNAGFATLAVAVAIPCLSFMAMRLWVFSQK